jgi:hypothetical protein
MTGLESGLQETQREHAQDYTRSGRAQNGLPLPRVSQRPCGTYTRDSESIQKAVGTLDNGGKHSVVSVWEGIEYPEWRVTVLEELKRVHSK